MIRFSLTTLLLVAFWLAALMLVWVRREPWYRLEKSAEFKLPSVAPTIIASDGRALEIVLSNNDGEINIFEDANIFRVPNLQTHLEVKLYAISFQRTVELDRWGSTDMGFLGDDLIALDSNRLMRRRFPEWWWGHFYRPEVWLALALTGALIWRGVRARRATATVKP